RRRQGKRARELQIIPLRQVLLVTVDRVGERVGRSRSDDRRVGQRVQPRAFFDRFDHERVGGSQILCAIANQQRPAAVALERRAIHVLDGVTRGQAGGRRQ